MVGACSASVLPPVSSIAVYTQRSLRAERGSTLGMTEREKLFESVRAHYTYSLVLFRMKRLSSHIGILSMQHPPETGFQHNPMKRQNVAQNTPSLDTDCCRKNITKVVPMPRTVDKHK